MRKVQATQYPDNELDALRKALDNKVTDKVALNTLYDGLRFAKSRNMALGELYDPGKVKDAKECVQRLDKALAKLVSGKGTASAAMRSITGGMDDLKRYAPGALSELDAHGLILLPVPEMIDPHTFERVSVFEQLINRVMAEPTPEDLQHLKQATFDFLDNCKTPGRGGARKEARTLIPGIQSLAETFRLALPDHAISANQNTLFPLYVAFWVKPDVGGDEKRPDMTRPIRNALEDLQHWEKVSL